MKVLILVVLMLTACGTDNSSYEETAPVAAEEKAEEVKSITPVVALPDCAYENENEIVFVIPEKTFYLCKSLQWQEVDSGSK